LKDKSWRQVALFGGYVTGLRSRKSDFADHGSLWVTERALSIAEQALFEEKEFFQSSGELFL
jgi:hypothetical protein